MNATMMLLPLMLANPPVTPIPPYAPGCVVCPPSLPGEPFQRENCPPTGPPAPVLAAKVLAPDGVRVTLTPGVKNAERYAAPVVAGFRPGYRAVLELTNLPDRPGEALYPVLEVYGSLVPRAGLNVLDYPAPIVLSAIDIQRALAGVMITKVIYLEDPMKAVPVDSTPNRPIEFTDIALDDALVAARENGRLVAVLRLGDRVFAPEELARLAVPGTVFAPGESFAPAAAPPMFPCHGVPVFDPILGPKPTPEECITDGGDVGPRLGIAPNGRLGGLNATDVALTYMSRGRLRVATSNRVCICAPRFVMRRVEMAPGGLLLASRLDVASQSTGRLVASQSSRPVGAFNLTKPVEADGRVRPAILLVRQGVAELLTLSRPQGLATVAGVVMVVGTVEIDEITSSPDRIVVTKSVDPATGVQVGDVVTFTIRYRNGTAHAATDLSLSDSLSGRLAFIDGSAQSDRAANISTAENEAGSRVVRFDIPGPVPSGEGGIVKFKARVR